jgi:hypothetical protein
MPGAKVNGERYVLLTVLSASGRYVSPCYAMQDLGGDETINLKLSILLSSMHFFVSLFHPGSVICYIDSLAFVKVFLHMDGYSNRCILEGFITSWLSLSKCFLTNNKYSIVFLGQLSGKF